MIADRRYGPRMLELLNWSAYLVDAIPRRIFRVFFPETPRPSDYLWSEVTSLWQPKVRLIDGTWSENGTLWRRRREDGRWEYQQDPETVEEQMDRIV